MIKALIGQGLSIIEVLREKLTRSIALIRIWIAMKWTIGNGVLVIIMIKIIKGQIRSEIREWWKNNQHSIKEITILKMWTIDFKIPIMYQFYQTINIDNFSLIVKQQKIIISKLRKLNQLKVVRIAKEKYINKNK